MTPEEKKNLVTAKLVERLKLVNTDKILGESGYWEEVGKLIMDDTPGLLDHAQPGGPTRPGLWTTIAPLVDSLVLRSAIENTLRRYSGMPLTESAVQEIMTGVDLELDRLSGVEANGGRRPVVSRAHSSSMVWGGRLTPDRGNRGDRDRGDEI